jgi:D-xylose transport system ATP-binding protein
MTEATAKGRMYLGRMAGVFATGELTEETVVDLMTAGRSERWSGRVEGVAS